DAAAPDAPDAGNDQAAADATAADASALGLDTRKAAVTQTVASNAACKLAAFYWEIGDGTGALVSGTVGTGITADTKMPIASASKLVWGAYVVERFKSDLTKIDANAMHMESGYVGLVYDACIGTKSVQACFDAASNSTFKAPLVGMFDYNGGHF